MLVKGHSTLAEDVDAGRLLHRLSEQVLKLG